MQNEPQPRSVQPVELDLLEQVVLLEKMVGASRKQLEFAAEMLKTVREVLKAGGKLTAGDGRDGPDGDRDPASAESTSDPSQVWSGE